MIPKEEFLTQLKTDRQTLLQTLDGVPDEALAQPGPNGAWSAMDILAHITAWDGEALRRIAFAVGESDRRPHDLDDIAHWWVWNERQLELKRMLGPRGVKVDLVGTWLRLLARIEALSPLDYTRWWEVGTGIRPGHDLAHAQELRAWRAAWESSLPWPRRALRKCKHFVPPFRNRVFRR